MISEEAAPDRWTKATVYDDMWVDPADDPREVDEPPVGERATLLQYLDAYRHTLRMKCDGLTPEQLALRSVPPSTMSLLGLVRHLAEVERSWSRRVMLAEEAPYLFPGSDLPDPDFDGAVGAPEVVDQAFSAWDGEIAFTDAMIAGIDDLGTMAKSTTNPISLRELVLHLIEEYARHSGHADLIRERVDGRVGQ